MDWAGSRLPSSPHPTFAVSGGVNFALFCYVCDRFGCVSRADYAEKLRVQRGRYKLAVSNLKCNTAPKVMYANGKRYERTARGQSDAGVAVRQQGWRHRAIRLQDQPQHHQPWLRRRLPQRFTPTPCAASASCGAFQGQTGTPKLHSCRALMDARSLAASCCAGCWSPSRLHTSSACIPGPTIHLARSNT